MAVITPAGPKGLYPDQTFLARDVVPDALIFQLATIAGNIEGDEPAVRVPFVAEDPTVGFVAEGDPIGEDNPDLDEVLVRTGKLAVISKQSNESATYTDANQLIADSLARAVTVKGNSALLSNPVDPTGLLNLAGVVDGGTLGENLDVLADAITTVEINGGTASNITMDPASWGAIRNLKAASNSNISLIGSPAEQTARTLYGLPVLVTPQMPAGTVLVSDRREIVAAVGPVKLATSEHAYYGSDSLARRVTWRLGWNVVRANRLAKVSVTLTES